MYWLDLTFQFNSVISLASYQISRLKLYTTLIDGTIYPCPFKVSGKGDKIDRLKIQVVKKVDKMLEIVTNPLTNDMLTFMKWKQEYNLCATM